MSLVAQRPNIGVFTFRRGASAETFVQAVFAACDAGTPALVTIDDVERIDDAGGHLARLLGSDDPLLRIVLAGRGDVLRSTYGHWSAPARRSRHGLALRPNTEIDGDLWQTPLPRRLQVRGGPGRGVLISDGAFVVMQVAQATSTWRSAGGAAQEPACETAPSGR